MAVVDGIRPDNGNAPSIFSQTYEALLCTPGLAIETALFKIYTIASKTNTDDRVRAAVALVAAGPPPPPRTGVPVKLCATCFGVSHDAGASPAKPGYTAK